MSDQPVAKATTYTEQQTNIHVLSGIRTRDPSSRAVADLCVRPKDHRDWPFFITLVINRVRSDPGVVATVSLVSSTYSS